MTWTFRTRRLLVIFLEGKDCDAQLASVHKLPSCRCPGLAFDHAGMKTRQQLVRQACEQATDTLIYDVIRHYSTRSKQNG